MKYIGTVFWNLFSTWIVFIVFQSAGDKQLVGLLVLILITLSNGFQSLELAAQKRGLALYQKLSGVNESDEEFVGVVKQHKILQNKFYITAVFNFILWIGAIINILS